MPIVHQKKWYTREQIRAERHRVFVFGDNLARRGLGGQAKAARGEPNAVGIATKRAPTMGPNEFFTDSDEDFAMVKAVWKEDFDPIIQALKEGKDVVFPADGIGTGLAQLPQRAPDLALLLGTMIRMLELTYGSRTE
jgi:hypothetical protein